MNPAAILFAAVAASLLVGCENPEQAAARRHQAAVARWRSNNPPPSTKQVQIISEPPGARIEINGDYIGDAPITTTIRCSGYGQFLQKILIRALPSQPGQYVQVKSMGRDDRVPSRVLFEMMLAPVTPQIDVNVNQ